MPAEDELLGLNALCGLRPAELADHANATYRPECAMRPPLIRTG